MNPKREKFKAALKKIDPKKVSKQDLLSKNLAQKVGYLEDRLKITIRLDSDVLEKAKDESEKTGVGYQKILNDRLRDAYALGKAPYLQNLDENFKLLVEELRKMSKALEEQNKKIARLEKKRA